MKLQKLNEYILEPKCLNCIHRKKTSYMEYGLRRFKSLTVIVGKGLCFIQKTNSPFYFLDIIPIWVIWVATVQITMIHTYNDIHV